VDRPPLTREAFAAALYGTAPRYWDRHPFHVRLHAGGCTAAEVRSWVANRWLYQTILARKNAFVVANCPVPEVRRHWTERVRWHDGTPGPAVATDGALHDGTPDAGAASGGGDSGGMADWLVLAEAVGLTRGEVLDERHVLPGVRFAVEAYLTFCRDRPWTEAVAASLTELFSPDLMAARVSAWRRHYTWIKPDGFAYFERRIPVVRRDGTHTLGIVLERCVTRDQQDAAVAALRFKCDVLNAMLDAIDYAGSGP